MEQYPLVFLSQVRRETGPPRGVTQRGAALGNVGPRRRAPLLLTWLWVGLARVHFRSAVPPQWPVAFVPGHPRGAPAEADPEER